MKVTLLGDSIRLLGYGKRTAELLGEGYEVWQPDDNCRFASYTLRGLFDWSAQMEGTDIVHWNNGLWDVCDLFDDGTFTPDEEYVNTMLRIAKILLSRYKKVIFATTTPVASDYRYNRNTDIIRFNEILTPKLREMGVIINDLFTPVYNDPDTMLADDKLHLSEQGIEFCAQQVADVIRAAAADL